MTLNRRTLIAAAAALVAGPAFAADAGEPVAAKKLFPYYDLYLSIPAADRSKFVMAYYLRKDGKPASGVTLTLISAGGARSPIPVGVDGRILKTPGPADLKDGKIAITKVNAADKFQLSMELQPLTRMAELVPAAEVAASVVQCRAAIKAKAGVIGFAAPKIEQVIFTGVTSGTAVMADGKTAPLPLFKGMPAYDPAALPGVASLKFPKVPGRALLAGRK